MTKRYFIDARECVFANDTEEATRFLQLGRGFCRSVGFIKAGVSLEGTVGEGVPSTESVVGYTYRADTSEYSNVGVGFSGGSTISINVAHLLKYSEENVPIT